MPRKKNRRKEIQRKRRAAEAAARPKTYPKGQRVLITPHSPLSAIAIAALAKLSK